MSGPLDKELATYSTKLANLLATSEGKFVIIHDDDVLGTFDTQMDAIAMGYRELGNVAFLVKQVTKTETPLNFVSNVLGI